MAEPLLQRLNQLQLHGMAARYREWQSQLRIFIHADQLIPSMAIAQ